MSLQTKQQLQEAYRLEKSGAEPIEIIAVLAPELFNKQEDICEHMPDDPDVYTCDFCGFER